MFPELISTVLSKLLFLALHVEGSHVFPKPFSASQERECFERLAKGDPQAKNDLIEHNLRLVAHIAKKYYSATNDQDDLISIGTIGLIKAVDTFTYDKKVRFSTYGARCIENEILMHFRNLKKSASDVSINEPIDSDKDGNALTLMDVVSDDIDMIDGIDLKLKSEQLQKYIRSELSSREAQIISLRYGLGGRKPLTQREIAKLLDISRSYVSRIEKRALEKLREKFQDTPFSQ